MKDYAFLFEQRCRRLDDSAKIRFMRRLSRLKVRPLAMLTMFLMILRCKS